MTDKRYSLKLTERELWTLSQAFDANWTDPDCRSELEVKLGDKISALHTKALRESDNHWPPRVWLE